MLPQKTGRYGICPREKRADMESAPDTERADMESAPTFDRKSRIFAYHLPQILHFKFKFAAVFTAAFSLYNANFMLKITPPAPILAKNCKKLKKFVKIYKNLLTNLTYYDKILNCIIIACIMESYKQAGQMRQKMKDYLNFCRIRHNFIEWSD